MRGITNHSSGKMGFAIARAAREAGAEVTLVAGPVHLPTPRGVRRQQRDDRAADVRCRGAQATQHDVFIATAAVADWRPGQFGRTQDQEGGQQVVPSFDLTENPTSWPLSPASRDAPYCVGFAAESERLLEHARAKMLRKGIPLIVGNLGPATFGRDDNALLLIDAQDRPGLAARRQPCRQAHPGPGLDARHRPTTSSSETP